jgi:hypothetical protein
LQSSTFKFRASTLNLFNCKFEVQNCNDELTKCAIRVQTCKVEALNLIIEHPDCNDEVQSINLAMVWLRIADCEFREKI